MEESLFLFSTLKSEEPFFNQQIRRNYDSANGSNMLMQDLTPSFIFSRILRGLTPLLLGQQFHDQHPERWATLILTFLVPACPA